MAAVSDLGGLFRALRCNVFLRFEPAAIGDWRNRCLPFLISELVAHCCQLKKRDLLAMELFSLGLNHEAAPVAVREKLAISKGELGGNCTSIVALEGFSDSLVLPIFLTPSRLIAMS